MHFPPVTWERRKILRLYICVCLVCAPAYYIELIAPVRMSIAEFLHVNATARRLEWDWDPTKMLWAEYTLFTEVQVTLNHTVSSF